MDNGIWATWYNLADDTRDTYPSGPTAPISRSCGSFPVMRGWRTTGMRAAGRR